MRLHNLVIFAATTVSALPNLQNRNEPDYSQWKPAGPNDLRSPCPALNSLANHGFLPRDGRGITLPILRQVLPFALNVGKDLADLFFFGAVTFGLTHDAKFDLADLNKHNAIEHDGSLSRADATTGDNHSFNQSIFDTYMDQFKGSDVINPALAGKARMFRIKTEQARDKEFKYGPREKLISNGETSLILGVFGGIDEGIAKKDLVKIWFEQERLPFHEGWRRPSKEINIINTAKMTHKVMNDSGERLQDGVVLTESMVLEAFRKLFKDRD